MEEEEDGYRLVSVVRTDLEEAGDSGQDTGSEASEERHQLVITVPPGPVPDILDLLTHDTDHAEARLAAKRQARAEAREIRMRELEKNREQEDSVERSFDASTPYSSTPSDGGGSRTCRANSVTPRLNNCFQSSRRSSEDSLDDNSTTLRDVRHELREVEDKFRKAMIGNAQLDNEKTAAVYQVELYRDRYEELEESFAQLQREHREKCREVDQLKRDSVRLGQELALTRAALDERDTLIQEQGLVIVGGDEEDEEEEEGEGSPPRPSRERHKRALVSQDMANFLDSAGTGSLDVRLKRLAAERSELADELAHIRLELEEERARARTGTSADAEDINREVNKQLGDYKFKLQKAEQDISTLQTTVTRLEGQVARYKTTTETLEKSEESLKTEKRKLLRELRENQSRVEELETAHTHLQKRLDKLKNAKSALLKDL